VNGSVMGALIASSQLPDDEAPGAAAVIDGDVGVTNGVPPGTTA
jgi:hypothetical protein